MYLPTGYEGIEVTASERAYDLTASNLPHTTETVPTHNITYKVKRSEEFANTLFTNITKCFECLKKPGTSVHDLTEKESALLSQTLNKEQPIIIISKPISVNDGVSNYFVIKLTAHAQQSESVREQCLEAIKLTEEAFSAGAATAAPASVTATAVAAATEAASAAGTTIATFLETAAVTTTASACDAPMHTT